MNKVFSLKVGDRTLKLCFNIIFGEQLAKMLKCEGTPSALMTALLKLNERSSFLMSKAILHAGILGHDYMVGFDESVTQEEVGKLIVESDAKQLSEMFNVMAKELGYDLKAKQEEEPKKKSVRKKKS